MGTGALGAVAKQIPFGDDKDKEPAQKQIPFGDDKDKELLAGVAEVDRDVAVAGGQGAEAVDALDGALGGEIEGGEPLRVVISTSEGAPSRSMENLRTVRLPAGFGAVGLLLLGAQDGLVDELDVIGEAVAEGSLLDGDGGDAGFGLEDGLGDLDAGGFAGGGLGGGRRGLRVAGAGRGFLPA